MPNRYSRKPIVIALLAAGLAAGTMPVFVDAVQEAVTFTPKRQITAADESVISSAAAKVLRHVAEARGHLQGDKPDTDAAKGELAQAETLLDIIQAALPTTEVKDRIWVARKHLEYEDSREVLPDLVPISASLDELVDYIPTAKAKSHLDQAKQALDQNQKEQAKAQLKEVDEALVYVEADLPLGSTRRLVDQAKSNLDRGDNKAADQALASAEDNVVFMSISLNSPLVQAKSALWRARQSFDLGDKALAKTSLQQAVDALAQASKTGDDRLREQAAKLVGEVRNLDRLLDAGDARFPSGLDRSWQRVQALSERTAETVSTGWERLRAKSPGKEDLIEAKLNLAYGRIDHSVAKDDAAAKVDLAQAMGYLTAAVKQIKPEEKPKVDALVKRADALDKALGAGNEKPSADLVAFQDIESELSALIQHL